MERDLKDYFEYDETSPSCLRRIKDTYSSRNKKTASAGDIAGNLQITSGYYQVSFYMKNLKSHRVIWEITYGPIPEGYDIDHIDGNPSNNLLSNLRVVTTSVNMRNSANRSDSTSGVRGVTLHSVTSNQGTVFQYWRARCVDLSGKEKMKFFSVEKLGYDNAFEQAKLYRQQLISGLNELGAGYTERHGK